MLDPRGHIATWNTGRCRASEGIPARGDRRAFFPLLSPGGHRSGLAGIRTENRGDRGDASEDEGWRIRKDGTQFWANVVITALRDPRGNCSASPMYWARDMTERKQAEENARRLVEETTRHKAEEMPADFRKSGNACTSRSPVSEMLSSALTPRGGSSFSIPSPSSSWAGRTRRHLDARCKWCSRSSTKSTREPVENPALRGRLRRHDRRPCQSHDPDLETWD